VVVVTGRFHALAESTRRSQGAPDAPMILLPDSDNLEFDGPDAWARAAEFAVRETVALLAAPDA
jgi:hypothetical protein